MDSEEVWGEYLVRARAEVLEEVLALWLALGRASELERVMAGGSVRAWEKALAKWSGLVWG